MRMAIRDKHAGRARITERAEGSIADALLMPLWLVLLSIALRRNAGRPGGPEGLGQRMSIAADITGWTSKHR